MIEDKLDKKEWIPFYGIVRILSNKKNGEMTTRDVALGTYHSLLIGSVGYAILQYIR